jgi:hypothetical protein
LNARLTVIGEIPARRATSAMVGALRGGVMCLWYRYRSGESSPAV